MNIYITHKEYAELARLSSLDRMSRDLGQIPLTKSPEEYIKSLMPASSWEFLMAATGVEPEVRVVEHPPVERVDKALWSPFVRGAWMRKAHRIYDRSLPILILPDGAYQSMRYMSGAEFQRSLWCVLASGAIVLRPKWIPHHFDLDRVRHVPRLYYGFTVTEAQKQAIQSLLSVLSLDVRFIETKAYAGAMSYLSPELTRGSSGPRWDEIQRRREQIESFLTPWSHGWRLPVEQRGYRAFPPETPPATFAAMFADEVKVRKQMLHPPVGRLRAAIAHPNCPPEILASWGSTCLADLLENPVTPLLPLEDPNFVDRAMLAWYARNEELCRRLPALIPFRRHTCQIV
jgi:hypothetical protein